MSVLLSIKPKYVKKILTGEKRYEFRKVIFKRRGIKKIYIYSSSPVRLIVGVFKIGDIIEGHPKVLWEKCKVHSGVSEVDFFNYFNGKERGFAIEIKEVTTFKKPKTLNELLPGYVPPQSFCYIKELRNLLEFS